MKSIDSSGEDDLYKRFYDARREGRGNLLVEAILADDSEAFVSISTSIMMRTIHPSYMLSICNYGAINIASALFEPDAILSLGEINERVMGYRFPLNIASVRFHYELVDLFLRHGARTDICDDDLGHPNNPPLKCVLDMLNYHAYLIDWNPTNSIYTLVTILCLPQMKEILETIKLLAWNTKDLNEVFNYYSEKEEGKLSQMTVLLIVAKELLWAPLQSKCASFVAESVCAFQSLKQEFEFLAALENKLLVDRTVLKDRMAYLRSALALFKLVERAGDTIRSYLQSRESDLPREIVIKDVTRIFKEAQFVLTDEDIDLSNIDRFKPGMTIPAIHPLKNEFYEQKVLHPLDNEFKIAKRKHLPVMRNRELVKQHWLYNISNPPWYPALRTKPQSNCTLRCCPTAFYKPMAMEAQNKGITSATQRHLLLFKTCNVFASCSII